ncbi:hypothetical protein HBI68_241490 [Parastagonospora nodorum]|nr:hypothetical protein HBI32_230220 [Parastagonospora nodorum]KAH6135220.1 hypothetical protein HBI68_241490 [Parastagonospora nodorum]
MSNHTLTEENVTATALKLLHTTLPDLLDGLKYGLFTSEQLVKAYLARITEVNHIFHATVEVNPDATVIARCLDNERHQRGYRRKLHGIPIFVKDNIPTLDAMDTTCGSMALVGARPAKEADIVTTLRNAGAIILGKGNMAEWSGFRSTSGCSGWSARGGQTKGAYYPEMKASGSSSGCAVAVSMGLCAAAVGTETCYSIVSPAEKAGIIGFKPTRNLLSSDGLIHASQRLDTVGLLTRTVSDAADILLELISHSNHHDVSAKDKLIKDITCSFSKTSLSTMRIGIPWSLQGLTILSLPKREAFRHVLIALQRAGATLVHDVHMPGAAEFEALTPAQKSIILDTDMKTSINTYLSSLVTNPQNIHNLHDLIAFTKACPEEEFPARNVEVLERAERTHPDDTLYLDILSRDEYFAGQGGIPGALDRRRCDVLLLPTLSVTMQTFAAKAGSPVLSLPMGVYAEDTLVERDDRNGLVDVAPGIPFSAYIFGRATKDEDVLRVGDVLEKALRVRKMLRPYIEAKSEIGDIQGGG